MQNKTRHCLVVANVLAGHGQPLKILKAVQDYLQDQKLSYTLWTAGLPASLIEFTDVLLLGGDGTVNYFINAFPGCTLPIGLIPAGSGNDLAAGLKLPADLPGQLASAVFGPTKAIDAGRCNDRLFINGVGIGFDGEAAKMVRSVRWLRGHLKYLYVVLRKILTYRESVMHILNADEELRLRPTLMVSVANGYRYGGGFKVAPLADLQDGLFDLVMVDPLSVLQRFYHLPRIEAGRHLHLPFVHFQRTNRVNIQGDGLLTAQLDGEIMEERCFDLELLPGKFWFRC